MEIVIKIPEGLKDVFENRTVTALDVEEMRMAIKNGTPLPKEHGDLVDRDAVNSRFYDIWRELESYSNKPSYKELLDRWSMRMDTAPTIIEGGDSE